MKTCKCGKEFNPVDKRKKLCEDCRKVKAITKYNDFCYTLLAYVQNLNGIADLISFYDYINQRASELRNLIKDYSPKTLNFRLDFEFENVKKVRDSVKVTHDHLNGVKQVAMVCLILMNNGKISNVEEFEAFLNSMCMQVEVAKAMNDSDLKVLQRNFVKPVDYIDVVGNIVGYSREESIEMIKPYFLTTAYPTEVEEIRENTDYE